MGQRRRLNREHVIDQAVALADAAGDAGSVTLAALAQALAIRPPSLYNHISSPDDLRAGMALATLRALLHDLRQAAAGLVGRAAVLALADAYRRFARRHPGTYPLVLRAPEPDEPEQAALAQEMVHLLQLVLASLGMEGDDAIHAIRGLRALLHGFIVLEAADGFKLAQDTDESFHRMLAVYLDGLGATG